MPTKQIDIVFNQKSAGQGGKETISVLQSIEAQANRTREKMQKLADVGNKLALAGGAIIAPFALAMKKYVDTAKETEPISRRLLALNQKWEQSQVRLGRVTAELVLPALEKALGYLDKVVSFAEANPGVVKAALTIGTTLVILGGIISTTAQLAATVATLQGLAASAGIAVGGGGAAAGGAAAGAGGAATVAAGVTAAIPAVVSAFALMLGGNLGLWLGNVLSGQNQTWQDIWETVKMLAVIVKTGWSILLKGIFDSNVNILKGILAGMANFGAIVTAAMRSLFVGGRASGGYMSTPGLYAVAENRQREFVMNASTTRNAERAIGGRLTQQSATSYMTNNINLANGMTVAQQERRMKNMENRAASRAFEMLLG